MRNWVIALTLIALCTPAHAALVDNPESFEEYYWPLPGDPLSYRGWESWGSGSGASGWAGWDDGAAIVSGGTDGDQCLQTSVGWSLFSGYTLAFNHATPIVPGGMYTYFFDYMSVNGGDGVFKLEFYDAENNPLSVEAWDPYPVATPGVWHHFSYTFTAPVDAEFATVVLGTTGMGGSIMLYDMVGLLPVYTDCWGLACSENPYTFSTPGNLNGMDGWTTWGNGTAIVSDDVCTINADSYKLALNHDNELAAIGNPVPDVDNVEVIIKVLSITGDAIVKIESYDAANSFPNTSTGTGPLRVDAWDPATKITGPGVYSFSTAEKGGPIPVDTAAITPTFGVSGSGAELVVDWIWIGKAGSFPYDPCPYEIAGDEDGDCMVTLNDLALMLANWLVDCIDDPANPACVTP